MTAIAWLRRAIACLGFGGGALFAAAFAWSWVDPGQVEHHARVAIEAEVRTRVDSQIDRLDDQRLAAVARRFSAESAAKAEDARRRLREDLPGKVAAVVAQMRQLDCECRRQVETGVAGRLESVILAHEDLQARLESLIRSQYMAVAGQILREFRIFTGVNAAVLLLLGVAVLWRRKAGVHLLPAAVVLTVSSVFVGYFYLFQQDWLHTLVFGDYVGFWYFGYLAVAALLLGDLLLNRARMTAQALTLLLGAIGTTVSVLPC